MKLYCLTDEIKEEIINVFLCKNDNVAIKTLEQDLKKQNIDIEIKLYSLPVSFDFDDKLYTFLDETEQFEPKLIYSYPKDKILKESEIRKEIINQEEKEV